MKFGELSGLFLFQKLGVARGNSRLDVFKVHQFKSGARNLAYRSSVIDQTR